jgi:cytoskeletal protein RodZ
MSKTVGLQLSQARQERGLTIEEVAQATHIRAHYLRLLEEGEFSALPSKTQARGFLRSYANYLELDATKLLADLETGGLASEQRDIRAQETEMQVVEPAFQPAPEESRPTERTSEISSNVTQQTPDSSQVYSIEIGSRLQKQRELLGLTFEEIERHTRLRKHYLQALEVGDLKGLPSSVQARGMLNNYAVFLGLDPEPLLLLFAEGLQDQLAIRRAAEQPSQKNARQRKTGRRSGSFPVDLVIGGIIGILMIAFVLWGGLRILSARSQDQVIEPTAPSIAEVLLASPTASASSTSLPATPLPQPTLTLAAAAIVTDSVSGEIVTSAEQGNVMLQLIIQQRTWLRVNVDGQIEFEGRVIPGSSLSFVGDTAVEILAGNGEALRVIFNGQDFGVLGDYGEVVNLIFTAEGVIEPTPTITFTPSATSPISILPSPTSVLSPVVGTATPVQGTPVLP